MACFQVATDRRDLTIEFYAQYAFARRSTLSRLRWLNPDVEPRLILGCSQKLLDRILFIAFCEDRGLLPAETIKRAFSYRDPYNPRPLWDNFRGMFRSVNIGNPDLNIHKYNGGLFADDPVLDGAQDSGRGLRAFSRSGRVRLPAAVGGRGYGNRLGFPAHRRRDPGPHLRTVDQRPGEAPGRARQAR